MNFNVFNLNEKIIFDIKGIIPCYFSNYNVSKFSTRSRIVINQIHISIKK